MNVTELLTADELADRLQVRPSTVRRWARRGVFQRSDSRPRLYGTTWRLLSML